MAIKNYRTLLFYSIIVIILFLLDRFSKLYILNLIQLINDVYIIKKRAFCFHIRPNSINNNQNIDYWKNKKTSLTRSIWFGQQGLSIKLITNKRSKI